MAADRLPFTTITRRALGGRIAAAALGIGAGAAAREAGAAMPAPLADPALRDAALRGLALAGFRGDPVTAAAANASLAQLAQTDPEAGLLVRIYQQFDVRPSHSFAGMAPAADAAVLAMLHETIASCRPVAFAYTDLDGNASWRTVLPLVLVHPAQGVKLLAWCMQREDFRQFFVRAIKGPDVRPGEFRSRRASLLAGLLDKYAYRA